MYKSDNIENIEIDDYKKFIVDIIETGNEYYISIFQHIIRESKKLMISNDIYSVDSSRFAIITFISKYEDILININPDDLKKEDFENLLKIF